MRSEPDRPSPELLVITDEVPTELRRPAKVESPAARTARLLVTRGDREFLDWQSAVLGTAETASAKEAAAREIFIRVASIVATVAARWNRKRPCKCQSSHLSWRWWRASSRHESHQLHPSKRAV